jgi:hypothetical protein
MVETCKVLIFEPGFSQEIGISRSSTEACRVSNLQVFIIMITNIMRPNSANKKVICVI